MSHYLNTTVTVIAVAANGSKTAEKNRPLWTNGSAFAVKWSGKLAQVTFVDQHTCAFELRAPRVAPTNEGKGGRGAVYAGWKPASTTDVKSIPAVPVPVASQPAKGRKAQVQATLPLPETAAAFLSAGVTEAPKGKAKRQTVAAPVAAEPAAKPRSPAQREATVRLCEANLRKAMATGDEGRIGRARKALHSALVHAGRAPEAEAATAAPVPTVRQRAAKAKAKAQPEAAQDLLAGKSQADLLALLETVTNKLAQAKA
ncbi:hypothetical protein TSH7_10015 [Azospirillum sp. TSH7]|uniref:hypothetical protein n=1 Tax=unclassified Azospirillum TaxID=2630922 RepID=UPI000D60AC67|nr:MULTISPECIES: hypothetical protein [unclassified Azospirillum]PWC64003.1 hypothetical protein TSH20_19110 [Azospirillum sp. TSH20]PWC64866.1 hypothetical protein TSH7_10015 [Azospirillum sp. TSH7]